MKKLREDSNWTWKIMELNRASQRERVSRKQEFKKKTAIENPNKWYLQMTLTIN